LNPDVFLAVRTRYQTDMPKLYELGVDLVVMDEWEASLELNRRVLEKFKIACDQIETILEGIRERKEFSIEEAILKRIK